VFGQIFSKWLVCPFLEGGHSRMKNSSKHLFPNRRIPRYRPLLAVAVCVGCGISLDRLVLPVAWSHGLSCWSIMAGVTLGAAILCGRLGSWNVASWGLGWWRLASWLLLASVVCLGGLWQHVRWNYFPSDDLGLFARETSSPVCVEAVALNRPRVKPAPPANPLRAMQLGPRSETLLRVERIRAGQNWRPASGYCKMRVAGILSGIQSGDRLLIHGKLGELPPTNNPGQYDWQSKERSEGRTCQIFCATSECVAVLQANSDWSIHRGIDQVRSWCHQVLLRYVGPDMGGLAAAILLGAREGLDPRVSTSYLQTGTVHLLVVSGLHVGILASLLWSIVRFGLLPRRRVLLLTIAVVVAYSALVGSRPPVVRATVIVVLWLLAMALGRKPSGINILAAAALVVLAWNPNELFRGGTQLSFLSVAALAAYARWLNDKGTFDPLDRLLLDASPWYRRGLRWILLGFWHVTIASALVWLITMPLVAYHFHILAPIGVLISPIVWPLFTVALVAGLGTLLVGWLPPVASLLGQGCAVCLQALQAMVQWAQGLEFGHFYGPGPPWWWLLLFYGGLALLSLRDGWQSEQGQAAQRQQVSRLLSFLGWPLARIFHNTSRLAGPIALIACWLGCGVWLATTRSADRDSLVCTFLAMGHGTCVVLELPGDQTVLYDVGSIGSPEGASRCVASYLWSRGITRIDAIVLSHADIDHYNGIPGLLERFSVGGIYVSPHMFGKPASNRYSQGQRPGPPAPHPMQETRQLSAPEYLRSIIQARGVPLHEISASDRLQTTDPCTRLEVLHPDRQGVDGRDNANSILLAVEHKGRRILLPGDLESPGLEAVLAGVSYDCDILLAPHHGSVYSDPAGFATWCTPQWVVVSGQRSDTDATVAHSYQQQGAKVVCTATQGAVRFALTNEGMSLFRFRSVTQDHLRQQ
jgi:competence protein ComEC